MSKHIAIIGGTSGIGRATVAQLQADGHMVYAACRSPEKLADLGIEAQPFDAAAPGPLTWPERLDGFVYFPGSISLKPFHRLTAEDFQRDLQVNLFGAIAALQSALPALKASGNASVVLFSTRGRAGATAYRNHALDNTPRRAGSGEDRFMSFTDEAGLEAMIASKEAQLSRKITRKASASQPKKRGMTKIDLKVADNKNSKRPVVKINSANLKANKIIKKRGK